MRDENPALFEIIKNWINNLFRDREGSDLVTDRVNSLKEVHNMFATTMERVQKKAREEGREEGVEQGLEKGRLEERQRNARAFKALGIPVETIAQATGLSIEEIEAL